MEQLLTIGKIVNTHGVRGEMRVKPITDKLETFDKLSEVYVVGRDTKVYEIAGIRPHKGFMLLRLKGIETMDAAELLKNYELKIERKNAIPLESDEYYISDLYDMEVETEEGRKLGVIVDILFTGSNDVYVIKNQETQKELLIPAIKQCIKKISLADNKMTVHLLEGLES
ncbi:MAG: ribosome maturation factor RimM [Cellulosilyticaceae bacterium]